MFPRHRICMHPPFLVAFASNKRNSQAAMKVMAKGVWIWLRRECPEWEFQASSSFGRRLQEALSWVKGKGSQCRQSWQANQPPWALEPHSTGTSGDGTEHAPLSYASSPPRSEGAGVFIHQCLSIIGQGLLPGGVSPGKSSLLFLLGEQTPGLSSSKVTWGCPQSQASLNTQNGGNGGNHVRIFPFRLIFILQTTQWENNLPIFHRLWHP